MGRRRQGSRERGRATDATGGTTDFGPRPSAGGFLATTRAVLLSPARFFVGMRRRGSLRGPLLYALTCAAIFVLLTQGARLAVLAARGGLPGVSFLGAEGLPGAFLFTGLLLALSPLLAVVLLCASAAAYQLLVRLFVGRENGGFGATLRVGAYLSAVQLLAWVPVLGPLAGLWGVWVNAAGLRSVHSASASRAVLVAGIPYLLSVGWSAVVLAGPATLPEILLSPGGFFPGA